MRNSKDLRWAWNRVRAMSGVELAVHLRRKTFQIADALRQRDWGTVALDITRSSPSLPDARTAPTALREAIARDAAEILAGRWTAFGHLPLLVDDPPKWHKDYLAGIELATTNQSLKLDHRRLPEGADIKLIWELSRWHALVRLGQAAWLCGDEVAGRKCLLWLADWHTHNPPFHGWNWTSALEAGIRLIQFAWIDASLRERVAAGAFDSELERLRYEILPAHVWFTWRNRSFGSSANNHLIGELAGLIVATARWPALEKWGAPLTLLRQLWEKEVLAQFAGDGGNREEALNYHLFSFELSWQARAALATAESPISSDVEERLKRAASFYVTVQVESDQWDYGDSDSAFVTPFFLSAFNAVTEWRSWLENSAASPGLNFWLGASRSSAAAIQPEPDRGELNISEAQTSEGWKVFPETGIAVRRRDPWVLRWDLSPLGYPATAAHGQLDALHLSIWLSGIAVVIDPGTGAYYADPALRTHLAGWSAHNGPCPVGLDWPKRLGPFLWSEHHLPPRWQMNEKRVQATLQLPTGVVCRGIAQMSDGWEVQDESTTDFQVHWQFAPGSVVEQAGRAIHVKRSGISMTVELDGWEQVSLENRIPRNSDLSPQTKSANGAGVCSQRFRSVVDGPLLRLGARGQSGINYTTRFHY